MVKLHSIPGQIKVVVFARQVLCIMLSHAWDICSEKSALVLIKVGGLIFGVSGEGPGVATSYPLPSYTNKIFPSSHT